MTEKSLQINFSLKGGGRPVDPYWLRMEMVKNDDTQMTVGEAADFIDTLYDVSICGRANDDPQTIELQETPAASAWEQALARLRLPSCEALAAMEDDAGAYDAQLKVYRSHQGELYKMLLSSGDIRSVVRTEERVTLTLDIEDKSYITLNTPIVHSPIIAWQGVDGPDIRIIGNTLYWDGVFTGVLRAEFNTIYDLVDIHVHGIATGEQEIVDGSIGDGKWLGTGWYSGDEDGTELLDAKDIECAVLAFYHYQFETIILHKPEIDESVSIDDMMAICEWAGSTIVPGDDDFGRDGECFKAVKSIEICECGGERNTIRKQVKTGCPPGVKSGTVVNEGKEEAGGFDFVDCGGRDEVSTDAYYEETCCRGRNDAAEDLLPKCRERHSLHIGNCKPDYEWLKKAYGEDVQVVMVGAKEGACGELIVTQDTSGSSCCEGVSGLSWDDERSAKVAAQGTVAIVYVEGGRLPVYVKVRGKGFSLDGEGLRDGIVDGHAINIFADDGSCGAAKVTVTDGCSTANGVVKSPNGSWYELPPIEQRQCPASGAADWSGSTFDIEFQQFQLRERPQGNTEWHPGAGCQNCLSGGISACNPPVWHSARCSECEGYTCIVKAKADTNGCTSNDDFENDNGVACVSSFFADGANMGGSQVDGLFIGESACIDDGNIPNYIMFEKNTQKTLYEWRC